VEDFFFANYNNISSISKADYLIQMF